MSKKQTVEAPPGVTPAASTRRPFPMVTLTQADYLELQAIMLEMRHKEALMLGRFLDLRLQRASAASSPVDPSAA